MEIPRLLWWFLLQGLVLPFRSKKSAEAYQTIWTERGSPLLALSNDLGDAVRGLIQTSLGNDVVVKVAMRYGRPSMAQCLTSMREQGMERLMIVPLYPQYSAATTASTFDVLNEVVSKWRRIPEIAFLSDYHDESAYISAVAASVTEHWNSHGRGQLLLFSFHGLPARSRELGDPYYDQCVRTTQLIASLLGLKESEWRLVFQSRFGKAEWLKPYCVDTLRSLPGEGVRSVDLICPGFSVDCLETLEEIAHTNKAEFIQAGGEQYRYIPALNARHDHAAAIAALILRKLG